MTARAPRQLSPMPMALGAVCFALPAQAQQLVLAAGFGGLHLSFGYQITRHYGG